jgi:hypothetical protein
MATYNTFANILSQLNGWLPVWITNRPLYRTGYTLLSLFATSMDYANEATAQGFEALSPGYTARTDQLASTGLARGIVQGEAESASSYAARQANYGAMWSIAGSDLSVAQRIHEYLADAPMVRVWTRNGKCTTVATDGTYSISKAVQGGWTAIGRYLPGTFNVTHSSASVACTVAQTTVLQGDIVYFTSQPSTPYVVASVVAGASPLLILTTIYSGTSNAATTCNDKGPLNGYGLNWDSVSNPERSSYWWDCWIVIYLTSEMPIQPVINGTGRTGVIPASDARRALGVGMQSTRAQRDAVTGLINTWRGAHINIRMIVWVPPSGPTGLFDPANVSASGNPNGLWGVGCFWGSCPSGTVGSGVGLWPSRNRGCRYSFPMPQRGD